METAAIQLHAQNIVGESLVWDDRRQMLFWVDIIAKRIHRFAPATGEHRWFSAPDFVTSIGLRDDGDYVVGFTKEIVIWDGDATFRPLARVEPDEPGNRLNEGVVGPDGAFWVGTMQNNIAPDGSPRDMDRSTGRIYRVKGDGKVDRVCADEFGITNTMVWTPDGRFVTADTLANAIYSYEIGQSGLLTDRRTIFEGFDRGLPDGSCMDADGAIWNCRVVGGSCIAKLSANGTLLEALELPCSWPTSCTFGGPGLDTLYISSARFTMSDAHLAAAPQEGALMALRPGVRGTVSHRMT